MDERGLMIWLGEMDRLGSAVTWCEQAPMLGAVGFATMAAAYEVETRRDGREF